MVMEPLSEEPKCRNNSYDSCLFSDVGLPLSGEEKR
jgi:hypothetical protein